MTETLANGYSSESTQRGLSNEYQHDRVKMVFKNICILVLWAKVASALEGLSRARARADENCFATSTQSRQDVPQKILVETK